MQSRDMTVEIESESGLGVEAFNTAALRPSLVCDVAATNRDMPRKLYGTADAGERLDHRPLPARAVRAPIGRVPLRLVGS